MNNIWFISDTHFFHDRILTFKDHQDTLIRGSRFSSTEEMDNTIRDNWNSLVKKSDTVYHLGDVFFGSKELFIPFWKSLNGNKHLIFGNHDNIRFFVENNLIQQSKLWKVFREHHFVATHVPIHDSGLDEKRVRFNVHGHLHHNVIDDSRYINVSVEQTEYRPIHIDEILDKVKKSG
jgi:calcineurin-like phosphoesterase family protein